MRLLKFGPFATILLLICIIATGKTEAQNFSYSSNGTMIRSRVYIDTVLRSQLRPANRVVFQHLDSTSRFYDTIRHVAPAYFQSAFNGKCDYFVVANLSDSAIYIHCINEQVVAEELSSLRDQGLKPVSIFTYPSCGTGIRYRGLYLKPSEVAVLVNEGRPKSNTSRKAVPNTVLRIKTSKGGLTSLGYPAQFSTTDFSLPADMAPFESNLKRSLATFNK